MPTTALNQRTAEKDLVFDNYQIPKGVSTTGLRVNMSAFELPHVPFQMFVPDGYGLQPRHHVPNGRTFQEGEWVPAGTVAQNGNEFGRFLQERTSVCVPPLRFRTEKLHRKTICLYGNGCRHIQSEYNKNLLLSSILFLGVFSTLRSSLPQVIRNFKVTYDHEPMTWQSKLLTAPSKPLKFKMTERPEWRDVYPEIVTSYERICNFSYSIYTPTRIFTLYIKYY